MFYIEIGNVELIVELSVLKGHKCIPTFINQTLFHKDISVPPLPDIGNEFLKISKRSFDIEFVNIYLYY